MAPEEGTDLGGARVVEGAVDLGHGAILPGRRHEHVAAADAATHLQEPAHRDACGRIVSTNRTDEGSTAMPYVYKVVEVREKMVGGKMSGERLEKLLNDHAAQGWRLKAITSTEVKGRVGPGGVEGLLVTFEAEQ